jgi:hypothetical protein
MSRLAIVWLILVAPFGTGCSNSKSGHSSQSLAAAASTQNSDASPLGGEAERVRRAVEEHVRNDQEINVSAMDMSVDSVNLNGDQAQARVTFRARQGGATMEMIYLLEQNGNDWQVTKGQPAEGQFVHPPMDQTHLGSGPKLGAPAMPDVQEFLKNHPATGSN